MWGGNTQDTESVVGLAYVGGVCRNVRYLISEDTGAFKFITVISHEIGHK